MGVVTHRPVEGELDTHRARGQPVAAEERGRRDGLAAQVRLDRGGQGPLGDDDRGRLAPMSIAVWEWGAYYGDAKTQGAKLDISKWKRPSPETIRG